MYIHISLLYKVNQVVKNDHILRIREQLYFIILIMLFINVHSFIGNLFKTDEFIIFIY